MPADKKIILFGAGIIGKFALYYYGSENVYCFVDNFKAGDTFCSKNIISFDELLLIHKKYEVVISVTYQLSDKLASQCREHGITAKIWVNVASYRDYESRPEIAGFKGRHEGKRCFLIGNGSSLCPEDLDILYEYNEITFGCNSIFKIFGSTKWRPHYYQITDSLCVNTDYRIIAEMDAKIKFVPCLEQLYLGDVCHAQDALRAGKGEIYFFHRQPPSDPENPLAFSDDPSRAIQDSATVIYPQIQMAAYMGFAEIFLLGVDNTQGIMHDADKYFSCKRHFYEDTLEKYKEFTATITVHMDEMSAEKLTTNGYMAAEKYSRKHRFRIYNATRGGELEIFERMDFDSLF